jgi:hypothetical protein
MNTMWVLLITINYNDLQCHEVHTKIHENVRWFLCYYGRKTQTLHYMLVYPDLNYINKFKQIYPQKCRQSIFLFSV